MCKFTLIFLFLDRTIKAAFVRTDFIIKSSRYSSTRENRSAGVESVEVNM